MKACILALLNLFFRGKAQRKFFAVSMLFMSSISFAQPPKGTGNGDPCSKPNPPKGCTAVPVNIDGLVIIGLFFGTVYYLRNRLSEGNTKSIYIKNKI
jgi:hypothetical protein